MMQLAPTELSQQSAGFLDIPRLTPCSGGIRVQGRFDLSRFHTDLFDQLALPRPTSLDRAIDKRLAEFLAGRAMAAQAQAALDLPVLPVAIGTDRAPQWPAGQAGSISHARGFCACFLVPESMGHPGIDIEAIAQGSALKSIDQVVLQEQDHAMLAASPLPADIAATLTFSAKETLFKALYPRVQTHFGFTSAELANPPSLQNLTLRLTKSLHPSLPKGAEFNISCEIASDHVQTWMLFTS